MSIWCPDVKLNCFQWILMIFGIYVIWVKVFDGIEHEHHNSLNMRIMADQVTAAFWHSWIQIFSESLPTWYVNITEEVTLFPECQWCGLQVYVYMNYVITLWIITQLRRRNKKHIKIVCIFYQIHNTNKPTKLSPINEWHVTQTYYIR